MHTLNHLRVLGNSATSHVIGGYRDMDKAEKMDCEQMVRSFFVQRVLSCPKVQKHAI